MGLAAESKDTRAHLIRAGVDLVRLHMTHGSKQWVADTTNRIHEVSAEVGRHVDIMMDVNGPVIGAQKVAQLIIRPTAENMLA